MTDSCIYSCFLGIGRLFIFALDKIFLVKVLNESDENKKTIAHKCEASKEGEYVGISLESKYK